MKRLMHVVVVAAVLAMPIALFAQPNCTLTRSQVKAELRALEQVGFNPARIDDANYPADMQAAEARVMQRNLASQDGADSGEGGAKAGSSQSGNCAP